MFCPSSTWMTAAVWSLLTIPVTYLFHGDVAPVTRGRSLSSSTPFSIRERMSFDEMLVPLGTVTTTLAPSAEACGKATWSLS